MPKLGVAELLIIVVIVLLLFGAGKIPEIGSSLGKGIRNFKKSMSEDDDKKEPAKSAASNDKTPSAKVEPRPGGSPAALARRLSECERSGKEG